MTVNPILRGFCPDPSIIKANGRFYIATSTFEWWPGVRLFESADLKHWKQIASPLRRREQLDLTGDPCSGGVWAPCLSYDGETFYLTYTDVKTKKGRYYNTNNYVVRTDDIYGEWWDPVYLNSIGFDPSLFHDDDGRKYLVNMINGFKGITVQELDPVSLLPAGERIMVYRGSGLGCLEGPHIYHIDGYYYLIAAEGGTGYDHCITMARADSLYGPYITCPNNPLITSDKGKGLQKCGHGDIVQADDGRWFMVHLCARPDEDAGGCILGRETAVLELILNEDKHFEPKGGSRYCPEYMDDPFVTGKYDMDDHLRNSKGDIDDHCSFSKCDMDDPDVYDDFENGTINVRYSSLRRDYNSFAHIDKENGRLVIRGEESLNSLHNVSLLAMRQTEHACRAGTRLFFAPKFCEQAAGIVYMYDNLNWYFLGISLDDNGNRVLILQKSDKGEIEDMCPPVRIHEATGGAYGEGGKDKDIGIELGIETDGKDISFLYGTQDKTERLDVKGSTAILTDEYCRGFTGAHFGLYAHDMAEHSITAEYEYFKLSYSVVKGQND